MKSRKAVPYKTQKKLLILSGNICCFPECKVKLYDLEEDVLIGEICHINAVSPLGARFDNSVPAFQIDSYDNLIMMCPIHHKIIDTNPEKYTIEILQKFKKNHEEWNLQFRIGNPEITTKQSDLDIAKELIEIDRVFDTKENKKLPLKKAYPEVRNYIVRTLASVINEEARAEESLPLNEIVEKYNRVVILGVAGTGKSIELDFIAHYYSQTDSELFPIKVRLNLLSDKDIVTYLKLEFPEFENVPQDQLLLILDALDEVHTDYIDRVANNIALLAKTYPKAKIVVSCRNNLYITEASNRSSKIENFKTYLLESLRREDILKYIRDNIKNEEDFIKRTHDSGLFDLLDSPFYLVNLVSYYNNYKNIPKNKTEVFEYLINERIAKDLDKYKTVGLKIHNYKNQIELIIEELAFTVQCLGRNYLLEKEEFHKIAEDPKILEIVNRTFLFNKDQAEKWMFEHNNFQEYLAAKRLSKFDFESIQKIVSFQDNKKIKPSWLNTLSFLFSILKSDNKTFNQLVDWLNDIESDILVRFEKDKIGLKTREIIFKNIYANYEKKGIRIGNEKFAIEDLAKFVYDSNEILEFLIQESEKDDNFISLVEKISLFGYFENVQNYRSQITKVLIAKISNSTIGNNTKYYCLIELANLKIFGAEITRDILTNNKLKYSKYLRAGFYNYILKSDQIENYIDIYIDGIEFVNKSERAISNIDDEQNEDSLNLFDEKYSLQKVISKIQRPDNIKLLLKNSNKYGYSTFYHDLIRTLLEKATLLHQQVHDEFFPEVLELLISLSKNHDKNLKTEFQSYFTKTNSLHQAYDALYKMWCSKDENKTLMSIALIANNEIIDKLINMSISGALNDNQIFQVRNIFNFNGYTEHANKFYAGICELNNGKFKYPENNYEERRDLRLKRDIKLLFAKEEFLNEAVNIFTTLEKTELTNDELLEYERANINVLNNNIVINTLRTWSKEMGIIELSRVEEIIKDESRWLWYKLHKLVSYDIKDKAFQFGLPEIKFIKDWVLSNIKLTNFITCIETQGDNNYHYRYTELFIVYFTERLNIELTEVDYLNFLFVDCDLVPFKRKSEEDKKEERLISEYVLNKVGLEKTKDKILQNLRTPNIYKGVRKNYFNFCSKHKIYECAEIVIDELSASMFSDYEKRELVDIFLDLKGELRLLEKILDKLEETLRLYVIGKLIECKSEKIEAICLVELSKASTKELELTYIEFLLKINSIANFRFLKEWILKFKNIPDTRFYAVNENNYEDLIEIYGDCLKNKYGNDKWSNNKDVYLFQIIEIGSKDKNLYLNTRKRLEFWIKDFEECKYLHYQIQKLDQMYYSTLPQALSFPEIEEILREKNAKRNSKLITYYNENKTRIDIILAILAVISFAIMIITMF